MSLGLLAILPHNLRTFEDVARVPLALRELAPLDRSVSEQYWGRPRELLNFDIPEHWSVDSSHRRSPEEEWKQGGQLAYCSSAETTIYVGRRILIASTVAKWFTARRQPPLLAAANHFFEKLALALEAPEFIVYHDRNCIVYEYLYSGLSIEHVRAEIVAGGAIPAAAIEDLYLTEAQLNHSATVPDFFYESATSQ